MLCERSHRVTFNGGRIEDSRRGQIVIVIVVIGFDVTIWNFVQIRAVAAVFTIRRHVHPFVRWSVHLARRLDSWRFIVSVFVICIARAVHRRYVYCRNSVLRPFRLKILCYMWNANLWQNKPHSCLQILFRRRFQVLCCVSIRYLICST